MLTLKQDIEKLSELVDRGRELHRAHLEAVMRFG